MPPAWKNSTRRPEEKKTSPGGSASEGTIIAKGTDIRRVNHVIPGFFQRLWGIGEYLGKWDLSGQKPRRSSSRWISLFRRTGMGSADRHGCEQHDSRSGRILLWIFHLGGIGVLISIEVADYSGFTGLRRPLGKMRWRLRISGDGNLEVPILSWNRNPKRGWEAWCHYLETDALQAEG